MRVRRVILIFKITLLLFTTSLQAASLEWLALGHYRPQWLGYQESTIDSENFFLSSDGKRNPEAELQASIDLFNSADIKKKCLFPARYIYLKKQGLISTSFPVCEEYEQFKKDLNPKGLTLLYTDAYMNNPSSLFGHTLLRIDIPEGRTQLVSHGVNYGAFVDPNENGVLFAFWGLTGGYLGGFTVKPYYDIINTYNNIENRDIWELRLNLTQEELDFFVAHLWEVGQTQTRYYFFTENCSYMLMEVLDAVKPEWQLAADFPIHAIPLDTLKSVAKRPGLVKDIAYRPSRQKRIQNQYNQMNKKERKAYLKLIHENEWDIEELTNQEKANVLQSAYEFYQYAYIEGDLELADYRKRSFETLRARTKIEEKDTFQPLEDVPSPLEAHDSARLTFSQGFRQGESFQEVSLRPAYHSLTDKNAGFLRGAEINFLNTVVRYYNQKEKLVLQDLSLVEITSISPWNALFHPISYNVKTTINREIDNKTNEEGYVYNLNGGTGISYAILPSTYVFGFVNTYFKYGGFIPHNQALGVGAVGGFLSDFDNFRLLGQIERIISYNNYLNQLNVKTEMVYSFTRNMAFAGEYRLNHKQGKSINEYMLGIRFHF